MCTVSKDNFEKSKKEIKKIINSLNAKTCCFTGHRPQSLPWGFNEQDDRCLKMKEKLRTQIINAINKGYNIFICGMALGFDIICTEQVLELKKQYTQIKIIGALPCKTQAKFWSKKDKLRYKSVLTKLDSIRCIYNHFIGNVCYLERNKYMINNSSLVIALFNGQDGGTKNTINYAKKQKIDIVIIEP